MASTNTKINFLCVEADKDLFGFLKTNSELVGKKNNKKIFIVNAFAGTLTHKVIMKEFVPGTKRVVTAGDNEIGIFSKPLDEIINQYINNQGSKISLIKTDTDGYDYDVINSSHKSIATFKPILFLEYFFDCIWQLDKYKKMIEELHGAGYNKFYMFDNFGANILKTSSYQHINEILKYNMDQSEGKTTKIIPYIDVVACTHADESIVDNALTKFLEYTRKKYPFK